MSLTEITWRQAERLAGERLDRRRVYARDGKRLLKLCRWTSSCSGCFEGGEYQGLAHNYPWDKKAQCHIGGGCRECGYTGKIGQTQWVPWLSADNHWHTCGCGQWVHAKLAPCTVCKARRRPNVNGQGPRE